MYFYFVYCSLTQFMVAHNLDVMGSNPGQVKLGVHSCLSRTWATNISCQCISLSENPCIWYHFTPLSKCDSTLLFFEVPDIQVVKMIAIRGTWSLLFMIWRSWVRTRVRPSLGCIVLLFKSYLNQTDLLIQVICSEKCTFWGWSGGLLTWVINLKSGGHKVRFNYIGLSNVPWPPLRDLISTGKHNFLSISPKYERSMPGNGCRFKICNMHVHPVRTLFISLNLPLEC